MFQKIILSGAFADANGLGLNMRSPLKSGVIQAYFSEFRRSTAAAERYEDLKRGAASARISGCGGRSGIARQVFTEFYSD
jgi:hypothetical protein